MERREKKKKITVASKLASWSWREGRGGSPPSPQVQMGAREEGLTRAQSEPGAGLGRDTVLQGRRGQAQDAQGRGWGGGFLILGWAGTCESARGGSPCARGLAVAAVLRPEGLGWHHTE